jgi:hypothetical protein
MTRAMLARRRTRFDTAKAVICAVLAVLLAVYASLGSLAHLGQCRLGLPSGPLHSGGEFGRNASRSRAASLA